MQKVIMAFLEQIHALCTNKLCKYEGTITICNREYPKEKSVCPKCGFKTFDYNAVSFVDNEAFRQTLKAAFK